MGVTGMVMRRWKVGIDKVICLLLVLCGGFTIVASIDMIMYARGKKRAYVYLLSTPLPFLPLQRSIKLTRIAARRTKSPRNR